MSSEHNTHSGMSTHVPIAILSLAVAIFFAVQLRSSSKQTEIMRWQLENLDKQTENLKKAEKQFADTLAKSEDTVKQAKQINGQYINLFNDLIDLAKEDNYAKEIVDKLGIKREDAPPADSKDGATEKKKDK